MILRAAISFLALLAPGEARALSLEFPALATSVAEQLVPGDSYFLPTAPFVDGPVTGIYAEGAVRQQSWRVGNGSLTTLQLLAPLRTQLTDAGFAPVFECEADICGGFDFRYQIEVLPEPDMHVNLGDFRYFVARRETEGKPEYVSLIVSRSANAGFVQLTSIGAAQDVAEVTTSTKAPPAQIALANAGPIAQQLETRGHATLDDLTFDTGSSTLGSDNFASLASLASYLVDRPDRTVMLVGHTDAEGALDTNIALSRRRAAAVVERLIQQYDIPVDQISADGVGFLAPRASNLTADGRTQNRRVEVIVTSTR